MRIDKYKIEDFNAILNSFVYTSGKIENVLYSTGMSHLVLKQTATPQNRTLIITFESSRDISALTTLLTKGATIDNDDGFLYDCLIGGTPSTKHLGCDYYEVSYPLSCIQKGRKVTGKLTRLVNHIHVQGSWTAPCKYVIKPLKDITTFTIDGYVIKNLKKGLPFVIDGIHKLVECNEVNRFGDVEMTKFPVLESGNNIIKLSSLDAEVTYEYDPIYM